MSRPPLSSHGDIPNKQIGAPQPRHLSAQEEMELFSRKGKGKVVELGQMSNDEHVFSEINAHSDVVKESKDVSHVKQAEKVIPLNEKAIIGASLDKVDEEMDAMWRIELDWEGDMEYSDKVGTDLLDDGDHDDWAFDKTGESQPGGSSEGEQQGRSSTGAHGEAERKTNQTGSNEGMLPTLALGNGISLDLSKMTPRYMYGSWHLIENSAWDSMRTKVEVPEQFKSNFGPNRGSQEEYTSQDIEGQQEFPLQTKQQGDNYQKGAKVPVRRSGRAKKSFASRMEKEGFIAPPTTSRKRQAVAKSPSQGVLRLTWLEETEFKNGTLGYNGLVSR
ncbi:hypothetical protein J5N97_011830 [Dioscorea zingiberensis]|uniref:Uncharacterized protein n=1 Tax=Dioscorea zingiberensis TaxID=325984 RepID=A0A9D5D3T1_9LILI|nr:hypothetical protein J5N97_011830 [Dioscorea zingiberensis]